MKGRRAIFFDRDGVVNRSPGEGYVLSWDQFHFIPGIIDVLRAVADRKVPAILVTSQKSVGKGLLPREELDAIHERMQAELRKEGVEFLDILVFTDTGEDPLWAKPGPGMLLEAKRRHQIDLGKSIVVGDQDRDITMGKNAGIGLTIRFLSQKAVEVEADYLVDNALELKELIESQLDSDTTP